ncbi:hypothetical protein AVEN_150254-1 [Araneus ventricosus]|uniref:Uncharacterized protein n=2 Tax=Araneus ventricosus TaxID=182803 RepID=A0A4Y2MHK8_ARAVE|nr:hypothetical protein AVEN_9244-1 [Araneus ventricosus]GBN26638.1 hypothetical protein AVEN_109874-1 [Araneus ventricosus]GBN26663.1 hypothetical protein AVEN_150254-1 [Araneus ventricosus]
MKRKTREAKTILRQGVSAQGESHGIVKTLDSEILLNLLVLAASGKVPTPQGRTCPFQDIFGNTWVKEPQKEKIQVQVSPPRLSTPPKRDFIRKQDSQTTNR